MWLIVRKREYDSEFACECDSEFACECDSKFACELAWLC